MSQADEIELAFAYVKQAGGTNPGVTYLEGGPLIWWTDGKTHSTLMLPLSRIHSVFDVSEHMRKSRDKGAAHESPAKVQP